MSSLAARRAALRSPVQASAPAPTSGFTIGSSELCIPLGLQRQHDDGEPYTSELELWSRLVGLLPRYDSAPAGPDAEIGRWMEPVGGARYAHELGLALGTDVYPGPTLDQPGLSCPELPWLHARPDFMVSALNRTLEVKCPRELDPDRWGPAGSDEVPPEYAVQVLAQVAVAHRLWGTDQGDLAAFARAPGWHDRRVWAVYHLRRDAAVEAGVIARAETWLDRYVRAGVPPQADGSESASRAIKRMFAPVDGSVHVATPTDLEAYRRLLSCRSAVEELEGRRREALQQLQLSMGDATELHGPDGEVLATWRPSKSGARPFRPKSTNNAIAEEAA